MEVNALERHEEHTFDVGHHVIAIEQRQDQREQVREQFRLFEAFQSFCRRYVVERLYRWSSGKRVDHNEVLLNKGKISENKFENKFESKFGCSQLSKAFADVTL